MALVATIPEPYEWDALSPVLVDLVGQVRDKLSERNMRVGRVVQLTPGQTPAWDNCCEGQLYSRVSTVRPVYGQRKADRTFCAPITYEVTCAIGVVRCAHTLDDRGVAPKPSKITQDGFDMVGDMFTLRDILTCSGLIASLGNWMPLGVEGGCHGGEWTFTLNLAG